CVGALSESNERMIEEQAALRRIAILVASGAEAGEVFEAVVGEAARVVDVETAMLGRYEPDRALTVVASLDSPAFVPGSRWGLDGPSVSATVLESRQPARIDDYSGLAGPIAAGGREAGLRPPGGGPLTVRGGGLGGPAG